MAVKGKTAHVQKRSSRFSEQRRKEETWMRLADVLTLNSQCKRREGK